MRNRQLSGSGNFVYDSVTPEVIDERVTRLHLMQRAVRRRRFKQRAQFHETMAGAAGIKSIESDRVFFSTIKWPAILKSHRRDATLVTASFCSNSKAEQIPPFMDGVNFFHDH